MTEEKLKKYLETAIIKLNFVAGVAMGLAPKDRREEILKLTNDTLAFTKEAEIYLRHKA